MLKFWCSTLLIPLLAISIPALYLTATYGPPPPNYGSGSMFDRIATRYDFINRALALNLDTGWRVQMVKAVTSNGALFRRRYEGENGGSGAKILDLATGTADVAILLADEAKQTIGAEVSSATVLGVDPSQNMISVGRGKVKARGLDEVVSLQIGDARKLSGLKDNEYDAATMAFGIRNVPEKDEALCEIWRVLKKTNSISDNDDSDNSSSYSKLAILEFSEPGPDTGILGALARLFIRHIVPVMGAALSGAPKEYLHLQNSIKEFPSPTEFKALMEGLQCTANTATITAGEDGEDGAESMTGAFLVDEIRQMNFGSVQLYVATPYVKTER